MSPTNSELVTLVVVVLITTTFAWTLGSLVNLLIYQIVNYFKNRRRRRRSDNGNTKDDGGSVKRARYRRRS